jgi:DNA (cytosine-5)-methyltransferase 1
MGTANSWQFRKTESLHGRLGLLDPVTAQKFRRHPIFLEPKGERPTKPFTAMGLTGGIGSMLAGASNHGFSIAGNIEWRDYYRWASLEGDSTFVNNYPGAFMSRGISDVPLDLIPSTIDFAVGHPECGMYSLLSAPLVNRTKDFESRKTDLGDIPLFLEYVKELQPKFFLMDDLPNSFAALPMSAYVDMLPEYDLFPEWISNWAYGNIQKYRNRMFIVGALKHEKFAFVPGEQSHELKTKDIIFDLTMLNGLGLLANHAEVDLESFTGRFKHIRFRGDSPSYRELREYFLSGDPVLRGNKPYYNSEGVLGERPGTTDPKWEGNCPVLSGGYDPIHPVRGTPLTLRERARIQGFPDNFIFYTSKTGPYEKVWDPFRGEGNRGVKQTGKAMPVQFCEFVAKQVSSHLLGKPLEASGKRVLSPNPKVSEAKIDFCKLGGYANQTKACENCWLKGNCELRGEYASKS